MTYDLTNLTGATNTFQLIKFANDVTGELLLTLFTFSIFFVFLLALKSRGSFEDALLTAGFISFLVSMVLAYAKLVPILIPLAFLIITAFTAFYSFSRGN